MKQLKIYSIHKKILTYEYDNDYINTLNWLLPVKKVKINKIEIRECET